MAVIVNNSVHPLIWHNILIRILTNVAPAKPMDALAREAFESGWICLEHETPDSEDATPVDAYVLFQLLHKLGGREELKTLSDDYIKRWHLQFLGSRDVSYWQDGEENMIISHSLSGHSPQLDSWLTVSLLNSTWSDEPDGAPDIGRLLAQVPAYQRTGSAQNHRRPVIIINNPIWEFTQIFDLAVDLLDKKLRTEMWLLSRPTYHQDPYGMWRNSTINLLQQQFCQYFFQKTTANGNQLHYCWWDGRARAQDIGYGSHQPSSPQELLAMFTSIWNRSVPKRRLDHALINKALNTSNALILDSDDFTPIIREYLNSIDLDLLSDHWQG